jgi:hypothetical protein
VSASEDGTTRIWSVATGDSTRIIPGEKGLTALAISPDGRHLVCGKSQDLWDVDESESRMTLGKRFNPPYSAAFSPDGRRIVSADVDRVVRIRDVATGLEVLALSGPGREGRCVAFRADGLALACASDDHQVYLWDAAPLNPNEWETREAVSLVREISAKVRAAAVALRLIGGGSVELHEDPKRVTNSDILRLIDCDPTICDSLRRRATALLQN